MHFHRHRVLFWFVFCLLGAWLLSACGSAPATPGGAGNATPPPALPALPTATAEASPAAPTLVQAGAASPTAPGAGAAQATFTPAASASPLAGVPTDTVSAFPDPAGFAWKPVVNGLQKPLDLATPADGSGRMLILEQAGIIRVAQNGALLPEPFLDISAQVGSSGSEQGLLGIALHPQYARNGFFYLNYTAKDGNTVIARYSVSQADANRADPNSQKVLLRVDQPYANHNGGSMVFGPDGYLYLGLGDGGSGGDPHGNGQSRETLLGKLLRIDVDQGDPYAIPADNPFARGGGKAEIWAYGLRNPWRFSFDRLTGDLYLADVGQNMWEEIDYLAGNRPGGANFGWNYREGKHPFRGQAPAGVDLIDPVFEYNHALGCSVTGGYVYRGQALPELRGVYLFGDFCSGRVWGLLRGADGTWQDRVFMQASGMNISSFGQDHNGELYLIDQGSGGVYQLQRK